MYGVRRTRYAGVAGRHREHFASPSPSSGSQLNIDRPMAGRGCSAPSLASVQTAAGWHTNVPAHCSAAFPASVTFCRSGSGDEC